MELIPDTSYRVPKNTSAKINAKIFQETVRNLEEVGRDPDKIEARIQELNKEWDIERAIEAMASSFTLAGLVFGSTIHKRWYLLPTVVAGFLLQHSIQGWCPPVPVLRRLGFRTQREIDEEIVILKDRRGDFD